MGEVVFRKNQYGLEVTKGTAVPATAMWPGVVRLPADRKPVFPKYVTGTRGAAIISQVNQYLVDGLMLESPEGGMVFEKLPLVFSIGLKGGVTAAEVTPAQGDYGWAFTPSLTASNTPDAITLETGDDVEQYEVEYVMAKRIRLGGKIGQNEGVTCEVECFGRQVSDSAFTAALTPGTLTPMTANLVKMWIDANWAALGTTQKTGLLREWNLEILTGYHFKFMADGQLYFSSHGEGVIDALLTMVYEGNTAADTEWDAFRAQTSRAIRIKVEGPVIGTGTANSLTIDLFGRYEEIVPMAQESEGNSLHTAVFHAISDNLATPHLIGVTVVCDSNAI